MKKYFILTILAIFILFSTKSQSLFGGKNIIKTKITNIPFGYYGITYERALGRFFSISISPRFSPLQNIPLANGISKAFNISKTNLKSNLINGTESVNSSIDVLNSKYNTKSLDLAGRFYVGLGKMKGIYISPYIRYTNLNYELPIKYGYFNADQNITYEDIEFVDGKVNAISYGLSFGYQMQILNKLVLDFGIVGAGAGRFSANLTTRDNVYVINSKNTTSLVEAVNDNLKKANINSTASFENDRVNFKFNGPWYSAIIFNLGVGVRF